MVASAGACVAVGWCGVTAVAPPPPALDAAGLAFAAAWVQCAAILVEMFETAAAATATAASAAATLVALSATVAAAVAAAPAAAPGVAPAAAVVAEFAAPSTGGGALAGCAVGPATLPVRCAAPASGGGGGGSGAAAAAAGWGEAGGGGILAATLLPSLDELAAALPRAVALPPATLGPDTAALPAAPTARAAEAPSPGAAVGGRNVGAVGSVRSFGAAEGTRALFSGGEVAGGALAPGLQPAVPAGTELIDVKLSSAPNRAVPFAITWLQGFGAADAGIFAKSGPDACWHAPLARLICWDPFAGAATALWLFPIIGAEAAAAAAIAGGCRGGSEWRAGRSRSLWCRRWRGQQSAYEAPGL